MTRLTKEANRALSQLDAEIDGADLAEVKKIRAKIAKLEQLAATKIQRLLEEVEEDS
jgi:hypothetical protein